ncbi:histidine utilization repressor [Pusillimonas sp. NJUB218]|uniref:histidine utilization repressor n=1 Tax=Pusillimonas sp. NJUB218 TaxID=2023230 RepID=UPI000F4CA8A5|nr:histidine utilization repressor [Pusillimonas sp. NJUB218]ROT46061.1 histidine utilization repressor [Pusillimonas sp. NJUB218]
MSEQEVPLYQRIKDYLLTEIQAGKWREGEVIPPEVSLARQFGVSRMTVNRAVRELTTENILKRIQGSGTYVAHRKYQATLVAIKNIADEVRSRGHRHSSQVLLLESAPASEAQTVQFEVQPGHLLFHSIIVHFDNQTPIQYEDRWVNAAVAPDYMTLDFSVSTPNEHLMRVAPLQGVRYCIEAVNAPADIAAHLHVPEHEACLVLYRTTLALDQVASVATMWYPGSRYQFEGRL